MKMNAGLNPQSCSWAVYLGPDGANARNQESNPSALLSGSILRSTDMDEARAPIGKLRKRPASGMLDQLEANVLSSSSNSDNLLTYSSHPTCTACNKHKDTDLTTKTHPSALQLWTIRRRAWFVFTHGCSQTPSDI